MKKLFLSISLAFFSLACQQAEPAVNSENLTRYELRGTVISVDKAAKKAEIEHEEIPGFMPRMTMNFPIKEDWVWDDLLPGVEVYADLVVDNSADEPYWLEKIRIVAAANPNAPMPEIKAPAQIGQEVPDAVLTNQEGKRFSIKDYRGKALAVTFIYRECPLPEYCIKMSQQFSNIALQLNANEEYRDKIGLLSISFDPERDTPAKLKEYGIGYLGNPEKPDFTVWQLAVGTDENVRKIADFFGLQYSVNEENKAEINHNLVTAVISPGGKVTKLLPGNRWTNDELMRELKTAADQ
ncbi:MAG: SCO family protein [Blastocatellia bacterium]|nr:SCO family protein [Blastocatellia bacterium]